MRYAHQHPGEADFTNVLVASGLSYGCTHKHRIGSVFVRGVFLKWQ